MSSTGSQTYSVQDIPGAGRGVILTKSISKDTLVLQSQGPATHVLHWEYRKEACAQCFYYNLGRTLPVRSPSTGKVFCTLKCQDIWRNEQREVGVHAWEGVHAFVTSRANAITNAHSLPQLCQKPQPEEIANAWARAAEVVKRIGGSTSPRMKKQKAPKIPASVVDPYILCFFLSGVLLRYHHPQRWQQEIVTLAMNDTPYQSTRDLEEHCNAFMQLASLLPTQLLPSLTASLCDTLIKAASHNAFGIHFGKEGEEYMGYAVYPEASYFNHSCAPNIDKKRSGEKWQFTAVRDVVEGEQCCITYLGGDEKTLSVTARRARLRQHWGFECMCLKCVEESSEQPKTSTGIDHN